MANDRVLVTGGSGFIGTNLVEALLASGKTVLNLDVASPLNPAHSKYWRKRDILDALGVQADFHEFSPRFLVHLAARTDIYERRSIEGYSANTLGVKNVLTAAQNSPEIERVLVSSSMLVCRLGYTPVADTDYAPPNLYGESKVLTETITRAFGLKPFWTIVRPTTVWGPWSLRYRDEFFRTLRRGLYIHPGRSPIMKSYGYVGNVVHQLLALLDAPANIVSGKTLYVGDLPIDLLEWVSGFSNEITGRAVKVAPIPFLRLLASFGDLTEKVGIRFPMTTFRLKNMTTKNVVDMSPTLAITGPNPHSLHAGILKTVKWLNENPR